MADRIVINFGADTREVEDGGRKIADTMGDVQDAVEDVGTAGDDSLDKVKRGAEDAADAAKDMGDEVSQSGGGFDELGGKADGALSDILDGLAGVAGVAGGVGGVVSSLVGGAIDVVTDAVKEQQKAAEELEKKFQSMYRTAIEEGRNYLTELQIQSAVTDIVIDKTSREAAQADARRIGLDQDTYIRALAGDQEALTAAIEASAAAAQKVTDALKEGVGAQGESLTNFDQSVNVAGQIYDQLVKQQEVQTENTNAANLALRLRSDDYEMIQKQNRALADAPKEIGTKLVIDDSDLEVVLQPRRLSVTIDTFDTYGRGLR